MSQKNALSSSNKSLLPEDVVAILNKGMIEGFQLSRPRDGYLYLVDKKVNDSMVPELCEWIVKLGAKVKKLDLDKNHITSVGASLLFDTLKMSNSSLKGIHLNWNKQIDDKCLKSLGEYVKSNKSIEILGLDWTGISDAGIKILVPYLDSNMIFKELYLNGNEGITNKSIPHLCEIINKSCISKMGLDGTSISYKKQQKIKAALSIPIDQREIPIQSNTKSAAKILLEMMNTINRLIKDGDKSSLNRAKIMTGGKGRAGKTATIRSLTGQSFNPSLESTIGADTKNDCEVDIKYADNEWKLLNNDEQKKEIASQHQARAMKINRKEKEEQDEKEMPMMMTKEKPRSVFQKLKGLFRSTIPKTISNKTSSSSASTPQISIDKNDNDKEEGKYELKGEMIDKYINDDGIENKITISIWDLGGQKVFYTLHHLFLTEYAVYLVVFDMRDFIQSTTNDEENEQRRMRMDESLGYIQHWLESIHMHAPGAPIFMIGTFKDEVKNDNDDYEMIDYELREMIENKMKMFDKESIVMNDDDVLMFWPIDNSQGPDSDDIKRLRRAIMETVEKQSFIKDPIPLQWTTTYDMMIDTNKNHITMDEFNLMAQRNGLKEGEDRLMMLRRFHQLGMLLYFDKGNDDMKNVIVLNAQWLVDAITKVIRQFDLHDYKDDIELRKEIKNKYFNDFKRMKDESIASVKLMYLLWRDEDNSPQGKGDFRRRRYLLSLMENMNLITPWMFDIDDNIGVVSASTSSSSISMNRNNRSPTHYLIPSNLRLFGEEVTNKRMMEINNVIPFTDIDNINNNINTDACNGLDCIVIDFSDSMLPVGLYDRLICKLVSHSSKHYQDNRKPIIGNGSILMSIGSGNVIRIDECVNKRLIMITIDEKSENRCMILTKIERMIGKLNEVVMNGYLKYTVYVSMWSKDKNKKDVLCMVDIDKVRDAIQSNSSKYVFAKNDKQILVSNVDRLWISQKMKNDKTNIIRIPEVIRIKAEKCEILERIGSGGFSKVYKIRMGNLNEIVAFKQFDILSDSIKDGEIKMIEKEIEMLEHLEHSNIVKIIGAIGDPDALDANNKLMGIGIVMEYCENGSLRSLLKNTNNQQQQLLNMDLIIHLLFGAAQGLEYLHNHMPRTIIHGDIKSDNILIDKEYNAKLCDFGISKLQQSSNASSSTTRGGGGTLVYKAPETFVVKVERKSDVYSFGCVILEMLTGERPWNELENDVGAIVTKVLVVKEQHDLSKVREDVKEELIDLMKRCLDYDKDKRPTMNEVRMELEKMMNNAVLIGLDDKSEEYNRVENIFFPGGDKERSLNRNNYRIVKIDKIRHLFAERRYDAELSNIKSILNSDDANERLLFHGTSETDPMMILDHPDAFMKDYSSQGFYGRGLYFAELARYSNGCYGVDKKTREELYYRYNIPNTNQYQMLVCSVICGVSFEMDKSVNDKTRELSQKHLGSEYHSIHAGPYRPGLIEPGDDDSCMYVIYKDTQVVARYVVTYENA